jgi:hypothetical protein
MSKSFGGVHDGFKTYQRGQSFAGKPCATSINITNFKKIQLELVVNSFPSITINLMVKFVMV